MIFKIINDLKHKNAENIVELDLQLGEYEDALLNYQELIDLYKEKLSGQKEKIGDFLLKLGFINYKIENYSDAKESLKEADIIFRDVIREIGKNDDPEIKNKLISKIQRIQKDLLKMQDLY